MELCVVAKTLLVLQWKTAHCILGVCMYIEQVRM